MNILNIKDIIHMLEIKDDKRLLGLNYEELYRKVNIINTYEKKKKNILLLQYGISDCANSIHIDNNIPGWIKDEYMQSYKEIYNLTFEFYKFLNRFKEDNCIYDDFNRKIQNSYHIHKSKFKECKKWMLLTENIIKKDKTKIRYFKDIYNDLNTKEDENLSYIEKIEKYSNGIRKTQTDIVDFINEVLMSNIDELHKEILKQEYEVIYDEFMNLSSSIAYSIRDMRKSDYRERLHIYEQKISHFIEIESEIRKILYIREVHDMLIAEYFNV